jgi:hypothetical protein
MNPRPALGDELRDWRIGPVRFEELDERRTRGEANDSRAVCVL